MLRRLHPDQPESFAFTAANEAWADAQISKYPDGRQASAIIPLLWRAQEQDGWLTRAAIEHVCGMLGMAYIRGLEVATFYFMFQLQPVGSVAHIQVCGTTSCMICGAEDLMGTCRDKIAPEAHQLSADGRFSWEEVECIGSCSNAPMAQIGKDYYEDLTAERLGEIIDELAAGKVPVPGPQNGRFAAEPLNGLTSLTDIEGAREDHNASVALALDLGDTIKRIDGTEVPLTAPWRHAGKQKQQPPKVHDDLMPPSGTKGKPGGRTKTEAAAKPKPGETAQAQTTGESGETKPAGLKAPREGGADDLKMIKGVGPKLETLLHDMGFFHYDQIAAWRAGEIAWVDENLKGFKGRVSRDGWVEQAARLARGEMTEFAAKAGKDGRYES